ncbi:hypothetical protein WR25_05466 [Diploscapter pachys]|uniref:Transcription factor AP-2 C-terminal domain-containing protein n=1 Tax=Diploscapter pachys TaxID=2018661 RepID=A0A2A2KMM8_9BILA|nr:hypothetical protein WR25_05466 [Diploscapter pachys]
MCDKKAMTMDTPKRWQQGNLMPPPPYACNLPAPLFQSTPNFGSSSQSAAMFPQSADAEYLQQVQMQMMFSSPQVFLQPQQPSNVSPPGTGSSHSSRDSHPNTTTSTDSGFADSADEDGLNDSVVDGNGDKGQYGEIVEQCKGGCQHEPGNYPDEHIYMKVPSRLALVGNLVKYPVSIGELRRRVAMPECLNSSNLGGLLRKAKVKSGGTDMRKDLMSMGITVPVGRRKTVTTTAFTSMVEYTVLILIRTSATTTEARASAMDLRNLIETSYPAKAVIDRLCNKRALLPTHDLNETKRDFIGAMRFLHELCQVLEEEEPPLTGAVDVRQSPDSALHAGMNHFSLLTHGFGIIDQRTWARCYYHLAQMGVSYLSPSAAPVIAPSQQTQSHHY